MPFNIGIGELVLVLIVALLVFGGRLPEVGRSLGKGLLEFKEGLKGVKAPEDEEGEDGDEDEEAVGREREGEGERDPDGEATPDQSP
jgi:sec-independent protein translocase protein TatA